MDPENIIPIEGQISINLQRHEKMSPRVTIISSRPLHATKVLTGKSPEQALAIIPLLFNICGVAQSHAALSCIGQVLQLDTTGKMEQARDLLVLSEIAKEHLLRVLIDWPELFNFEFDIHRHNLPYLGQLVANFKSALFDQGRAFTLDSKLNKDISAAEMLVGRLDLYCQDHVFSGPLEQWLSIRSVDDLRDWAVQSDGMAGRTLHAIFELDWTSQGNSHCSPLPELNDEQLLKIFTGEDADQFIAKPEWLGKCHETTPLSRQLQHPLIQIFHDQFDSGLVTRWVARLVELALIPQQMRSLLQSISSNNNPAQPCGHYGIAQVEAARGRLIHRVEIEQQRIKNYQILAPTEWNFHPRGLIEQSLTHINAEDENELELLARLMINAIDPCVGYRLSIQ